MPGAAAAALPAAGVVDQCDAAPVLGLRDDLVPEHRPGRPHADLLHVRSAQPAGEHPNELAGSLGLRDVGKAGIAVWA